MRYKITGLIVLLQLVLHTSCLPLKKGPPPQEAAPDSSEEFLAKLYYTKDCRSSDNGVYAETMSEVVISRETGQLYTISHRLDFDLLMFKNNEALLEYRYRVDYERDDRSVSPTNNQTRRFQKKLTWSYDETTLTFLDESSGAHFNVVRAAGGNSRKGPLVNPHEMFNALPAELLAKIFSNANTVNLDWGRGSQALDESLSFENRCEDEHVFRFDNEEDYRQELVYQVNCSKEDQASYMTLELYEDKGTDANHVGLTRAKPRNVKMDIYLFADGSAQVDYNYITYLGAYPWSVEFKQSITDISWRYENFKLEIERLNGTGAKIVINTVKRDNIVIENGEGLFSEIDFGDDVLTDNPLYTATLDTESHSTNSTSIVSGYSNFCQ